MRNQKESGVEKSKNQAWTRLRDQCLDSLAWKLRRAKRMVERAFPARIELVAFCVVDEKFLRGQCDAANRYIADCRNLRYT